ncbi:hypothetical protein PAEPH01_0879 [Pancytospora epiphaga]|nr:hypothetical protein PAEPH01_0879 [Pancytospora epiphaga]
MKWWSVFSFILAFRTTEYSHPSNGTLLKQTSEYSISNIKQQILYEYYMNIDSIVFLIGAYNLTKKELDSIIGLVLTAKKLILKDNKTIEQIGNLSSITRGDSEVRELLKRRKSILKGDKSFISVNIIKKAQKNMLERIKGLSEIIKLKTATDALNTYREGVIANISITLNPARDHEYKDMMHRLKQIVYENGPIGKQLKHEKEEFYKKYENIEPAKIQNIKISLSLGGFIINPHVFSELVAGLNIVDKEERVRKWVGDMMRAAEELELRIQTKSFIEKKRILKEYLESFFNPKHGNVDNILELRSEIFKTLFKSEKELGLGIWKQEAYIRSMIWVIGNIRKDEWMIRCNKEITEDYTIFLLTEQQEDKKQLFTHFK